MPATSASVLATSAGERLGSTSELSEQAHGRCSALPARRRRDYDAGVLEALSRRRLLRAAIGGLAALGVLPGAALAKGNRSPG